MGFWTDAQQGGAGFFGKKPTPAVRKPPPVYAPPPALSGAGSYFAPPAQSNGVGVTTHALTSSPAQPPAPAPSSGGATPQRPYMDASGRLTDAQGRHQGDPGFGAVEGPRQIAGTTQDPTFQTGGYADIAGPLRANAGIASPTPASALPPVHGTLEDPGNLETAYADNKDRLSKPSAGENILGEAAGFFRGPNLAHDVAQGAAGFFSTPGTAEGFTERQLPGLENQKSARELLYESGDQGLNTWYDREFQKRQKRLGDQMAGMGVFGSGATARGMFELEAEMGSQQARDMADLAGESDAGRIERLTLGNTVGKTGQEAGEGRFQTGVNVANTGDASLDRQGRSLGDVGKGLGDLENARDTLLFDTADKSQRAGEKRKLYPLDSAITVAGAKAGINERGTGAISAEQTQIAYDTIQTLLTGGALDANDADALQAELATNGGNVLRILELIKQGQTLAQARASAGDGNGTLPPGAAY